jgi:hypothetical protein
MAHQKQLPFSQALSSAKYCEDGHVVLVISKNNEMAISLSITA